MSALSPYAVEFVQGRAYAGKVSDQSRNMEDNLSESLSKVKVGTRKSNRPKAGKAYDVSLESMLIETALSRIQQQPLPVAKPETSNPKTQEKTQRKKKFIRPSDANKKLSKLKKSVVNYREEQAREASAEAGQVPELPGHSGNDIEADHPSCHAETAAGTDTAGAKTDADSDGTSGEAGTPVLDTANRPETCEVSPDLAAASEDRVAQGAEDCGKASIGAPTSANFSTTAETNSCKQPLKRTPTMDRLKANLQGDALKEVEQLATELIIGLKRFQDRLYNKDEVKARMRQRMYYGLKESIKFMQGSKVKMIIMARDLEAGPGGLDELIESLLSKAKIHRVPVVIALSRNKLKRLSQKPSKVACIAITDASGRDEQFEKILDIVKPIGIFDDLHEAGLRAETEEQERKAQEDLENWTSTTRRGRFEFAVDKLFST